MEAQLRDTRDKLIEKDLALKETTTKLEETQEMLKETKAKLHEFEAMLTVTEKGIDDLTVLNQRKEQEVNEKVSIIEIFKLKQHSMK